MSDASLLYRQVHPSWVQQGRVTSQAFKPTPKDRKRLSMYDGDRISAERAWTHYTVGLGFVSAGVLAVSRGECLAVNLPVEADPDPFPEHVVIRFDGLSAAEITTTAKHLCHAAAARGWLYTAG
jgi:hypothetical protein